MPDVISNSSPIIHLAKIGKLHLLQEFYGQLIIPQAVHEECVLEGRHREEIAVIKNADWFLRATVKNTSLVRLLLSQLDCGEAEVIALALERPTDLLLLDDADAREKAKIYHLSFTGTLGILLRAKQEGKIGSFRDILEHLRETGFWVTDSVKKKFLAAAGE